ncbi:hypothetical protein QAD02_019315 [Eretmocerus hayati]|uniref:Uncharacterized protein n=1 Tax=Eretmocerus hayati TaxID=131215 RepID=A0ACC2PKF4_9HYME|nr:hypothetical protein QAD02_019315 [Eretmocerus hayati]
MDVSLLLLVIILTSTIFYWFLTKNYSYWNKQGIPYVPDPVPGFGHVLPIITLRESAAALFTKIYNRTQASVIGFYFMQKPAVIVRDPELVKSVLVTNYHSFSNNMVKLDEKSDPVMSKNPFFAKDQHTWKMNRSRIANQIAGGKLRQLYVIIEQVCEKMLAYVDRKIDQNDGVFECEMKDFFTKFTGEIVANAAFAIEGQSFEDKPDKWAYVNVARTVFKPTFIHGIKHSLILYLPRIAAFFRLGYLTDSARQYFSENIKAIIKQRQKSGDTPNDYLQSIIDANDKNDIDSIISDIIVFHTDVYETSSTTLSSVFYQLSKNPDAQTKLREDITTKSKSHHGCITYESLKEMDFLEYVINEALRLMPTVGRFIKMCTNEITLVGNDGLKCHIKPGSPVVIPVLGLHHDEKYWPDPEKFDPDRFQPDNQIGRHKNVYLPFGDGPKLCVGYRLGILLVKIATATLITRFSIEPSSITKEPLKLEPASLLTYFEGGLWVKFTKFHNKI